MGAPLCNEDACYQIVESKIGPSLGWVKIILEECAGIYQHRVAALHLLHNVAGPREIQDNLPSTRFLALLLCTTKGGALNSIHMILLAVRCTLRSNTLSTKAAVMYSCAGSMQTFGVSLGVGSKRKFMRLPSCTAIQCLDGNSHQTS